MQFMSEVANYGLQDTSMLCPEKKWPKCFFVISPRKLGQCWWQDWSPIC